MLRDLRAKLAENGLTLEVSQEARELLVKEGSDTRYGARPLRRAVRKMLEDPVSDLYLAGMFKAGDTICASVGESGNIVFTPKKVEVVLTHEEIHPAEVNNGQNQNYICVPELRLPHGHMDGALPRLRHGGQPSRRS